MLMSAVENLNNQKPTIKGCVGIFLITRKYELFL